MGRATPWISLSLVAAAGCGAGFRSERVGTIRTTVGPLGEQSPTLAAVPIVHASDRHRVDVAFYLPRAAEVHYSVSCPGQSFEGMVGESWEHYRQRRLAELERERQREVETVGALTGAVLGSAGAGARVETPNAEAEVAAEVDGEAVGRAAAEGSIPQVQLDPRDVGTQSHKRQFQLVPGEKGQCTVSIWSETDGDQIQGVTADMTVTRVVDIAAERAATRERSNSIALDVRGQVTASLVAAGADPAKLERERRAREAEAERVRLAELELRRHEEQERREIEWREQQAELELRQRERAEREREAARIREEQRREQQVTLEYERSITTGAYRVRGRIVGELVAGGCDPNKARREREERERLVRVQREEHARLIREQREEQARLIREQREEQARIMREEREHGERVRRGAFGIRAHIVGELIASGADPEYQRKRDEAELRAFEARTEQRRQAQLELELQFHAALQVREAVRMSLQAAGAVDRPVPQPVYVETPTNVHVEAEAGIEAGVEVNADAAVWVPPVEVIVEGVKVFRPGSWRHKKTGRRVKVRDHRKPDRVRVRDHR